tara:strand:+ start:521 stop:2167 length:1647 start_codon:yes stop_codon:yes gene_type:complete
MVNVIYDQEKEDGISIKLLTAGSISYASCAVPAEPTESIKNSKSLASYSDKDLYYVQSILVSSNWNKNDDIFDKAEVWKAKNTPEDKPTNLEHDENTIIGHIVSNWPIDSEGNVLPEDTKLSEVPDKFHIVTASVIYRGFSDPKLKIRSEELIDEIENGSKYVSMECFFNNFDYGLIDKTSGTYKILNRNHNTAYLTKYLRAYGGLGEFENYKIGRVLRNITFSGKGFVDKPANEESIIFTKNNMLPEKNEENQKIGVFDNQTRSHLMETEIMAENKPETEELSEDLEAAKAELSEKVEALEAQIAEHDKAQEEAAKACEADVLAMKEKLEADHCGQRDAMKDELEAGYHDKMKAMKEELEAGYHDKMKAMKEELEAVHHEEMKKKEEENAMYKKELAEKDELLATYRKNEEDRMMAEMYKKRMATLIEAGLSEEDAEAATKTFESFDDEKFEAIVATLNKVSTQDPKPEEVEAAEAEEATEAEASEVEETSEEATEEAEETSEASEVLDSVEVEEEVNLGVGEESDSEVESTRAALVDFVYSRLGKK